MSRADPQTISEHIKEFREWSVVQKYGHIGNTNICAYDVVIQVLATEPG